MNEGQAFEDLKRWCDENDMSFRIEYGSASHLFEIEVSSLLTSYVFFLKNISDLSIATSILFKELEK